jgi:hypothetical protein
MADEADQAQFIEERDRNLALRARHATLTAIGLCYSCGDAVPEGRKFCDRDCLDDFERVERARKRGGQAGE